MKINVNFGTLPMITPIYISNRSYEVSFQWLRSDNKTYSINYIEQKLK